MNENKYPLVSILIPAYKPQFFEEALNSALNQTYKNIEIIICDDRVDDKIKEIVDSYLLKHNNIKYFNNGGNLGLFGTENERRCFSLATGEYINFLNDDDLFHPNKIERMVEYLKVPGISLVTSHRRLIDSKGNELPDNMATERVIDVDCIFEGKYLAKKILIEGVNFIGEPTTVLFRKKDVEEFGVFLGRRYIWHSDLSTWLSLLLKGDCAYISETLSSFRIHEEQLTCNEELVKICLEELSQFLEDACKAGIISMDKI